MVAVVRFAGPLVFWVRRGRNIRKGRNRRQGLGPLLLLHVRHEPRWESMSTGLEGLRTLSVKQLAEAMNVQPWRIYDEIAAGTAPPFFRLGTTYRFRVIDVAAWMEQRTQHKTQ